MELTPFNIYIWQQADSVGNFLTILLTLTSFLFLWFVVAAWENNNESETKLYFKRLCASLFGLFLSTCLPSSKTIAMMYVVPSVAESKIIQEDAPEIYNMAVESLKSWIKENTLTTED